MLRRGECDKARGDPIEVALIDALISLVSVYLSETVPALVQMLSLINLESVERAKILLFRSPDSIENVLNADAEVGLAVASVAERHQWRLSLSDWSQC